MRPLALLCLFAAAGCGEALAQAGTCSGPDGDGDASALVPRLAPHLVLRGADGELVDARVLPDLPRPWPPERRFGQRRDECVLLDYLEDLRVWLSYGVETGSLDDCYGLRDAWPVDTYLTTDCSGRPVGSELDHTVVRLAEGYFHRSATRVDEARPLHRLSDGECTPTEDDRGLPYYEYAPVPTWALEALPNPPYRVVVEY